MESKPCWAILKITIKTTTPTPSLKSDSPTILVSSFLGALASFKIPNTAIGSVGEISAPKSKTVEVIDRIVEGQKQVIHHRPNQKVEITMPMVAKSAMGPFVF